MLTMCHGYLACASSPSSGTPTASPLAIPPPEVLAALARAPEPTPPAASPSTSTALGSDALFDQAPSLASTPPNHVTAVGASSMQPHSTGRHSTQPSADGSGGTVRLHASSDSAHWSAVDQLSARQLTSSEQSSGPLGASSASVESKRGRGAVQGPGSVGPSPVHSARSSVGSGEGPAGERGALARLFAEDDAEGVAHDDPAAGSETQGSVVDTPQSRGPMTDAGSVEGTAVGTAVGTSLGTAVGTHAHQNGWLATRAAMTDSSMEHSQAPPSHGNHHTHTHTHETSHEPHHTNVMSEALSEPLSEALSEASPAPARRTWLSGWWSRPTPAAGAPATQPPEAAVKPDTHGGAHAEQHDGLLVSPQRGSGVQPTNHTTLAATPSGAPPPSPTLTAARGPPAVPTAAAAPRAAAGGDAPPGTMQSSAQPGAAHPSGSRVEGLVDKPGHEGVASEPGPLSGTQGAPLRAPLTPSSPFVEVEEAQQRVAAGRGAALQHAQRSKRALVSSTRGMDPFGMAQARGCMVVVVHIVLHVPCGCMFCTWRCCACCPTCAAAVSTNMSQQTHPTNHVSKHVPPTP